MTRPDRMRVYVHVHPRSRRDAVGGCYGPPAKRSLVVRVTAPAIEGRANKAVVVAVAQALGVKRAEVSLVGGEHSREKVLEVPLSAQAALERLLGEPPGR